MLGALTIEPSLRRVARSDGRERFLQPRIMQVLVALAASPGAILSRDDLLARCWNGVVVGEDAIDRAIGQLRRLLADLGDGQVQLETITKVGYRLKAPRNEPVSDLIERTAEDTGSAQAVTPPPSPLLAVLAFDNLSGDPDFHYFSDGVAEEILLTVSRTTTLRVVGRSSSFQFRGIDKSAANIAQALGVTHVLDGSVRRNGQRVRINAQLTACATGEGLWSHSFDRDLDDIFALQDEIAESVAKALAVMFLPAKTITEMPLATYEVFLQAQAIISEGTGLFDDSGARAAPLLERVVRDAPDHARAWELLAACRAWTLRSSRRKGSYQVGREGVVFAAETALRLDPDCAGALEALAFLEPWGAYAARERQLERALRMRPHEPRLLSAMSTFCWGVGRMRDALSFAERACELNPLLPAARLAVAEMQAYVGNYETAVRMLADLHRKWPENVTILAALLANASSLGFWDAYEEGLAHVENFSGWQADRLRIQVGHANTLASDDPTAGHKVLDQFRTSLARTGTVRLNWLAALCHYGMPNEALDLGEEASFDHIFDADGPLPSQYFPGTIFGPWCTMNRNPRFIDLCDRIGLCAYWSQSNRWPDCADWLPYDLKAESRRRVAAADGRK